MTRRERQTPRQGLSGKSRCPGPWKAWPSTAQVQGLRVTRERCQEAWNKRCPPPQPCTEESQEPRLSCTVFRPEATGSNQSKDGLWSFVPKWPVGHRCHVGPPQCPAESDSSSGKVTTVGIDKRSNWVIRLEELAMLWVWKGKKGQESGVLLCLAGALQHGSVGQDGPQGKE